MILKRQMQSTLRNIYVTAAVCTTGPTRADVVTGRRLTVLTTKGSAGLFVNFVCLHTLRREFDCKVIIGT